jgi:hypothetical protein
MPNRIIRDGILTSPKVARLGWPEEVLYRRLMSVVDDFGRYFADPGMVRAACYPRQLGKVSDSDVGKWLHACADAGLVRVYPASDGESYLELLNFRQQVRAKESKYPAHDERLRSRCIADAAQPIANARLDVDVDVDVDVSEDDCTHAGTREGPPAPDVLASPPAEPADPIVGVVVDAYHEALPDCRRWEVLTPKRRRLIREAEKLARGVCRAQSWHYDPDEFWPAFFDRCRDDPWKAGKRGNPKNPDWKQDLSILLRDEHFARTMDEAIAAMKGAA